MVDDDVQRFLFLFRVCDEACFSVTDDTNIL